MTELQLYKFIHENNIEYHTHDRDGKPDVIVFIYSWYIEEWIKLFENSGIVDEAGIECTMKDGYFCFWMNEICEHFNIEIKSIFPKKNHDD